MARTIEEIKKEMTDAFLADETLRLQYGFNPSKSFNEQFSKASLESIIFYIIACSIWVLEKLFDKHQEEVSETISKRAHTLRWYREKAFAFQYGYDLREDIAEYDNSNLTDEQIEQSRIVKKCSCESVNAVFPTIQVKAVTSSGKMTHDQWSAFKSYMEEIADAGVKIVVKSQNPDEVVFGMKIYYDPLLMNSEGTLYNEGVENAVYGYIDDYFGKLEYNGDLYPQLLESYLMTCPGIKVVNITSAFVKAEGDNVVDISGMSRYSPLSGAFVYNKDIKPELTPNYIPFNENEQSV